MILVLQLAQTAETKARKKVHEAAVEAQSAQAQVLAAKQASIATQQRAAEQEAQKKTEVASQKEQIAHAAEGEAKAAEQVCMLWVVGHTLDAFMSWLNSEFLANTRLDISRCTRPNTACQVAFNLPKGQTATAAQQAAAAARMKVGQCLIVASVPLRYCQVDRSIFECDCCIHLPAPITVVCTPMPP